MSNSSPSNSSPNNSSSDSDIMVLLLGGAVLLGSAGTIAALAWTKVLAWGLEQQVLLPASAVPLVVLPWSDGAGVDLARLAVAVAVVVVVLAVAATAATKKMRGNGDLQ